MRHLYLLIGLAAHHTTAEQGDLTQLVVVVLQSLLQVVTAVVEGDKLIDGIGTNKILQCLKLALVQESIVILALQGFLLTLQISHHVIILHRVRAKASCFQVSQNLGRHLSHLFYREHALTFLFQGFLLADDVEDTY